MMLTFGSLFTGIGGFDLGFERAGIKCLWQCEIDPACNKVLAKHWPDVKRYTDVREIGKHNLETVDVICGGFPCQDVSIAGKRAGLAGERSGLWSEFARIIDQLNPRWVIIENVPGLLSSNKGNDFASIIRWLVERGYGVAWRILDAQYFGVPQRRRRVFIVGSLGDGRATEVLFEREGVSGNTPPSRKEGERITSSVTPSIVSNGDSHSGFRDEVGLIVGTLDHKSCSNNRGSQANETDFLVANTLASGSSRCHSDITSGQGDKNIIWQNHQQSGEVRIQNDNVPTLGRNIGTGGNNVPMVGVRRLTPTECARLQGFPDDWNSWLADAPRYRQYGNAVCVPVAEWIGQRIVEG